MPSVRRLRHDLFVPDVARLYVESYGVCGRRRMHALMRRQGWQIGGDQTVRLMKIAGVQGVRHSKIAFAAKSGPASVKPADLVNRQLASFTPRRLWGRT